MATFTKRGQSWLVQVRRKGFPSRSKTFRTKADAIAWAAQEEAVLMNGRGAPCSLPTSLTLRSIVQRYLEKVTPNKRSAETERCRLLKLLRDPIAETPLANLSTAVLVDYRDRRSINVGAGTIRRELSLLNHMLDLARREWGISLQANPVTDVGKPRLRNSRTRRLGNDEWPGLRCALAQSRNAWILSIVELAVETALRRGELLDLRWSRIDLPSATALIPYTKTDRPRVIPLTPAAIQLLESLPRDGDRVFPVSSNAAKLAWARAVKRAGIHDLRFHDLRHEAVSRFFEMGLSLPEVALISGHRDPRMLMRYTHLRASELAQKLAEVALVRSR